MSNFVFRLEGKDEDLRLTQAEIEERARRPFKGKVKPTGKKKAIIFWGAPNAAKSMSGNAMFQALPEEEKASTIPVCYDESTGHTEGDTTNINRPGVGAIFSIDEYAAFYAEAEKYALKETLSAQEEAACRKWLSGVYAENGWDYQRIAQMPHWQAVREGLIEIYRKTRWDSQRVRSLTLNHAVDEGYSVFIDTTSSGRGAAIMVDLLKQQGYEIEYWGWVSPFDLSIERASKRMRIVEPEEVWSKRAGAFEMLPILLDKADTFRLFQNEGNTTENKEVLRLKGGKIEVLDQIGLNLIAERLDQDVARFRTGQDEGALTYGRKFADKMAAATDAVKDTFAGFIRKGVSAVYGPKVEQPPKIA